ncbi:MAG TPA: hypothetical protein VM618_06985 [Acidimicrobiia bacterium]|nr:hypothetical protein [Acidimicrobiia bacterium]
MAAPASEHRRAMIIAAVGFGLVAVLFVFSRLLSGDDGGDDAAPVAPPPTTAPGLPPGGVLPEVDDDLDQIPELPDAFEIVELRDPFESPLLEAAIDAVPPPSPGGGTTPTTAPGTTPTTAPPGDDGEQRVDDDAPGDDVELVAIDETGAAPVAAVDVDGQRFQAAAGERFGPADEFEVASIDTTSDCVLFRRGDEPFTLCVGEERLIK